MKLTRLQLLVLCGVVLGLVIVVVRVYLHSGMVFTHDGENHLARFANYKVAIKEGQFPPRFAPNLLNRYGYPVFNYNYPLANILSLPFSALGIQYEITFKILIFAALVFGGWGVVMWVGALKPLKTTKPHQSVILPLIYTLGVYYCAHYLVNALVFRGNIGEVIAYGLLPWLFYWVIKPELKPRYILLWAAFFLAHNLVAFFGSLVLIGVFVVNRLKERSKKAKLLPILIIPTLALGLSLWFWLPAVLELNMVAAGSSQLVTDAVAHFPTLNQLLFAPLQFGFSYPGSVDSLGFSLGAVQWLSLIVGIFLYFKMIYQKKFNVGLPIIYLVLAVLTLLLQLPFAKPIWQALPMLSLLQFPWRLSLFTSIFVIPLAFVVFVNASRLLKMLLLLVCFLQILVSVSIQPLSRFHKSEVEYDLFPETTNTDNENKPLGFKYLLFGDWQPQPKIERGTGQFQVTGWQGSSREYSLNLKERSLIIEPTVWFPGWETTVTDANHNKTLVPYFDDDTVQGRLAYYLEEGQYLVQTRFTQHTPARVWGNGLSLLAMGGFCLYSYQYWRRTKIKK